MAKKYLMLMLIFSFLLSACGTNIPAATEVPSTVATEAPTEAPTAPPTEAPTEAPTEPTTPPEPVFDETPDLAETAVTVDGELLEAVYQADDLLWLAVTDDCETSVEVTASGTTVCTAACSDGLRFSNTKAFLYRDDQPTLLDAIPRYDGTQWFLPLNSWMEIQGYTCLEDPEDGHLYFTLIPDYSQIPDGCDVPILMYHAVSDNIWGEAELFVSPSILEEQLIYLKENGYTPIFFEDLVNVDQIEKPVILTFDDGYTDNYYELLPILERQQVKATVFMIAGHIGMRTKMTETELKALAQSEYVSIQSHTMTHNFLGAMNEPSLVYEMEQSRLVLTRLLGKQPFVVCYPSGSYSELTCEVGARYYSAGIKMTGGLYTTGTCELFEIPRFYVSRYTTMDQFREKLGENISDE